MEKVVSEADLRRKISALCAVAVSAIGVLEDCDAGIVPTVSEENKIAFVNRVIDEALISFADYWGVGGNAGQ